MNPQKKITHSKHNDSKETLVQVENILYQLVPVETTLEDIKRMSPKEAPHIRFLNPIPLRSKEEQEIKNKEVETFASLAEKCSPRNDKVTSLKKAQVLGSDVSEEVKKLIKEKEEAKKKKDLKRVRQIRKLLRKLDFKRYLPGENNEES